MPDPISVRYSISVQIAGGPALSMAENVYTNAYERIVFQLDEKNGPLARKNVSLPPKIDILALTASSYTDDLTYSSADTSKETKFTAPILLIGTSTVERFIGADASSSGATRLSFVNNSDTPVTIEIMVAHDAIESVPSTSPPVSPASSTPSKSPSSKSKPGTTSSESLPESPSSEDTSPTS